MSKPSEIRPGLLARALRPLRHLFPLHWRTGLKIWIRDQPRRRGALNRLLTWFTGAATRPALARGEADLPPTGPGDWRDNPTASSPLVSVVIPCHNYGRFLPDALGSLRSQTFQDFEIIIVDDGSDDPATLECLAGISDPRTRVIRQENCGQALTRTRGISEACGKYICCLDADDMLMPTHLEKHLYALEARQCDEAHGDLERFGEGEGVARFGEFDLATLLDHCSVNTAAVFRRDAWAKTGGHSDAMRAGFCDWNFWIDLAAAGCRGVHLREPLHLWRRHGSSITSASTRRQRDLLDRIRELHRDLIDSPERVEAISASRRRTLARNPFVNLSAARFLPPAEGRARALLIFPTPLDSPSCSAVLDLSGRLAPEWELSSLVCAELFPDADPTDLLRLAHAGIPCYHLLPMIPPEFHAQFPAHLAQCHRISALIVIGPALGDDALDAASAVEGLSVISVESPHDTERIRRALG